MISKLLGIKDAIDRIEDAQAWNVLLPPYVLPSLEATSTKVEEQVTMFGMYIAQNEADMKKATSSWKAVLGDVKECICRAKVQIAEAKKMQMG